MRKIEVCCTSVADVVEAYHGGAIRVELCSAISCGGVTPSHGLISEAVAEAARLAGCSCRAAHETVAGGASRIKVNVLIRPREGSFVYSPSEVRTMLSDISFCREAGADGVVIGALTPEGDIDMDACRSMVAAAGPMSVTFHRAFDVCRNPERALEQIIALGCDRLLTSGQQPVALDGVELISRLVRLAAGRISIMPGSGISPANIDKIEQSTGASEFHSTARAAVPDPDCHHVPALGFDEPSAPMPVSACLPDASSTMAHGSNAIASPSIASRYILRTSRSIVRSLVG